MPAPKAAGSIRHGQPVAQRDEPIGGPPKLQGVKNGTRVNLDVAEIADDKDLGMAGWHCCSQREALGRLGPADRRGR